MAFSFTPLNPRLGISLSPPILPFLSSSSSSSSSSSCVPVLRTQILFLPRSNHHGSHASLSFEAEEEDSVEVDNKDKGLDETTKKKKKNKKKNPKPSFNAQTLQRWSAKISSQRSSFPWQGQKIQAFEEFGASGTRSDQFVGYDGVPKADSANQVIGKPRRTSLNLIVEKLDGAANGKHSGSDFSDGSLERSVDKIPPMSSTVRGVPSRVRSTSAPWAYGAGQRENSIHSGFEKKIVVKVHDSIEEDERPEEGTLLDGKDRGSDFDDPVAVSVNEGFPVISAESNSHVSSIEGASFRDLSFASPEANSDSRVSNESSPETHESPISRKDSRTAARVEKLDGAANEKHLGSDFSYSSLERSVGKIPPISNNVRGVPYGIRSTSTPWAHAAKQGQNPIHSSFEKRNLVKTRDSIVEDKRSEEVASVDGSDRGIDFGDPVAVAVNEGLFPVMPAESNSKVSSNGGASFREHNFDPLEANSESALSNEASLEIYESPVSRKYSSAAAIVQNLNDSMCPSSSKFDKGDYSISELDSNSRHHFPMLASSVSLPWERVCDSDVGVQLHRSNTELAEKTIPEPELRRLRDAALRMKERTTVGPAGVTEAVVKSIHEIWKENEVVKLRFEGPPSLNMKRTHEILEIKTGGLVIWRSGRSVVLYRGMTYELPCIQTYSKLADTDSSHNCNTPGNISEKSFCISRRSGASTGTLIEGSQDTSFIDSLLDQLGPRFKDWSGRSPLPVDADLLPGIVPGYTPPFRLLPYKTRSSLRDREMTALRRLARTMPPHFALGRNRQHQGLAAAIVKLWEKSSIAKIAIKRGIPNTHNERMAEEIKKLTGGVLISRNKEYIVLYRGNDFVTPPVREVLMEKEKLATIHQDEEEVARLRASASVAPIRVAKGPLVAGTLAETVEARSRWEKPVSSEEREILKKDMVLAKHASLVRYLERKLIFAKSKFRKAEKALAKVQEFLKPADLPTDLETVTDEERALFRKLGLKMKGALRLGRREVFDGTVENMHLHWKNSELVKILVKGKKISQVKHIAISLEAESGGILISLDKTTKGYAIIVYRGKNYQRPHILRPKTLLSRRQALARSIELQRREALIHHISDLQHKIQKLKSQLDQMEAERELGKQDLDFQVDDALILDDDDDVEDEGEEAYLQTYGSGDDEDDVEDASSS